ncbi:hypothetical protein D9758_011845 [Tetrapyrgos nigripes]|uniref:Uncharacterized protein n=1 Tax=Tetrapyrgos nigripes TaxID=182062 RepID=A0A8H5CL33_9AGAR|nr:hypothetical protein D9758_011845 [Tetrapyrgos nigripes]
MSDQEQSGPLSDEDLAILKEWIIQTAVEFLLYGVYATLSLIALYFLLASDIRRSKTQFCLFALGIFMLLFSTSIIVLQLEYILVQIPLKGYDPPDMLTVTRLLKDMKISDDFFIRLNFLISDCVLVWRSWILYPRGFMVKIALCVSVLVSVVCTFVDAGTGTIRLRRENSVTDIVNNPEGGNDTLLLTLPLLLTNLLASVLIGYKAWRHRQEIKNNLNDESPPVNKMQKVLLLLVESGSIYFVLWFTFTVISAIQTSSTQHSFTTYRQVMPMLSALYPVLIILLASIEYGGKEKSKNGLSLSQTIRYGTAGPNLPSEKPGRKRDAPAQNRSQVVTLTHMGSSSSEMRANFAAGEQERK